jgi:hypothetical protein
MKKQISKQAKLQRKMLYTKSTKPVEVTAFLPVISPPRLSEQRLDLVLYQVTAQKQQSITINCYTFMLEINVSRLYSTYS